VFKFNHVSCDFQEAMGLQMISGRFFSKEHNEDSRAVIINEAAAKVLGVEDLIGQELTSPWHKGERLTIIGVVNNFHIRSLHKTIEPMVMELMTENSDANGYITIKINSTKHIRETVQFIEQTWARHSNGKLFESFFFDEDYENIYKAEFTTGRIMFVFAGLSVFIACLGMVGLLAFTVSARKKEIGIRKVLGSTMGHLIYLLSSDTIKLILIATLIAWPLAYFGTEYWQQNFVYQSGINLLTFIFAPTAMALICGLAIVLQIMKAIGDNPINSLKSE
jgi:putative ABC transport system permease protein